MKYILGTKEEMTQVFAESGIVTPATVVRVPENVVTAVRTKDRDGYTAVQLGMGKQKPHRLTKAQLGHLKGKGPFVYLREFRVADDAPVPKEGDRVTVETFQPEDPVHVSGTSKGKGFQGVVKRHGFKGGPRTHGQKHSERSSGSIGATGPQRVFKGTRMAGRMGGERITVKNLKVLAVDPEENLLVISGAIPGRRGSLVEIYGEGEITFQPPETETQAEENTQAQTQSSQPAEEKTQDSREENAPESSEKSSEEDKPQTDSPSEADGSQSENPDEQKSPETVNT